MVMKRRRQRPRGGPSIARDINEWLFWRGRPIRRDSGYAFGTLIAGIAADHFGLRWATGTVALPTLASGVVVAAVMGRL